MTENKRLIALRLMLDELECPSRELRLMAQAMDCKSEMYVICEWLRREVEREIAIETMFEEPPLLST
jgi:hypothetical protein